MEKEDGGWKMKKQLEKERVERRRWVRLEEESREWRRKGVDGEYS
jgi:hypothetical protein